MNFEKLGAFYLGKQYDLDQEILLDDLILYDSKDLTTHAVCVGMTGSGKTGLCVSLLEEAAMDGVPALVIDPKGDLGNLMLTFPDLKSSDFQPWVDEQKALRQGRTVSSHATATANLWKKGLAGWGQDGERIRALKEKADVRIYTPGSTAGIPLAVLQSFQAPSAAVLNDSEALQDRIQAAVSGLLALLGKSADPVSSREYILLSNLLHTAWSENRSLDIPAIIREVQSPPFNRIGVFDLETFFPASDRMELALEINGILASPGFEDWLKGEPLDIGRMLYTPEGRPRLAIVSIAHLQEKERMFFVTLLLNEMLSWIRSQPGTSSLRALLYMDEIYGYFPPTAMPPSKRPMLTLLKQARAYGLGIVLATQNPVDLDYKGLSNTGTWFIGRLQTERDKARVLDGLEGASAGTGFERSRMEQVLSSVGKRVFLLHNVHENEPVIFHTRWAMSYLRGPLTRSQIQQLMAPLKTGQGAPDSEDGVGDVPSSASKTPSPGTSETKPSVTGKDRPMVSQGVEEYFIPAAQTSSGSLLYRPCLFANVRLHYVRAAARVDTWQYRVLFTDLPEAGAQASWDTSEVRIGERLDVLRDPQDGFRFSSTENLPASTWIKQAASELKSHLYQDHPGRLLHCKMLKTWSELHEEEGAFRGRLVHQLREQRDLDVESLRSKYEKKVATIEDRIRRAQQKVEREQDQYSQKKFQTLVSVGATLVGAMFGGRRSSLGKAATAMRGVGRAASERGDIQRAEQDLEARQADLNELEAAFEEDLKSLEDQYHPEAIELEEITFPPRKTDLAIPEFGILWRPWSIDADGIASPLYG